MELLEGSIVMKDGAEKKQFQGAGIVCPVKLKERVSILKKKLTPVKNAKKTLEDILRKAGTSVDGSHHQSTFLSQRGDFIGGSTDPSHSHVRQILNTTNEGHKANDLQDSGDKLLDAA